MKDEMDSKLEKLLEISPAIENSVYYVAAMERARSSQFDYSAINQYDTILPPSGSSGSRSSSSNSHSSSSNSSSKSCKSSRPDLT